MLIKSRNIAVVRLKCEGARSFRRIRFSSPVTISLTRMRANDCIVYLSISFFFVNGNFVSVSVARVRFMFCLACIIIDSRSCNNAKEKREICNVVDTNSIFIYVSLCLCALRICVCVAMQ